ncbi:MAG TPA: transaldolase [Steroidobacteraceae bacterium]|nr:transaldolase [Steroidobacteraceae bacterium]
MKPTEELTRRGQSLWLDNITRDLLSKGTLKRYISELSVRGLTSNPTIFDQAIRNGAAYDAAIRQLLASGHSGERLFFELALQDLAAAADLFREVHERSSGVDGWVSLEVSPLLARDARTTLAEAKDLHGRAGRPNLYIKIPGTAEGLPAIEEAIFAGVPINVTLLFSPAQYLAAAEAYLRGVERRIAAGLNPNVSSVASVFISRWDVAVSGRVPDRLTNTLGLAIGRGCYRAYSSLLCSSRWRQAFNAGARPQRLLFASTGTKDPKAPDILYVKGLHAPLTVNTVPEKTLQAFYDHGELGSDWSADAAAGEEALDAFRAAGIDLEALARKLQDDGAASFVASWNDLLKVIEGKTASFGTPARAIAH